jgi:hypothetical protein
MDLSHIRKKIARGELPGTDWEGTRLTLGGLFPCAVCDTPTTPADAAVECQHGGGRVLLHPDCYVLWEEARRNGQ